LARPLWAVAGVALLGIAGGAGILIASSGGEEEVVQRVATATAAATATSSPASTSATPVASPTSTPESSPSPIPDDWPTYTDPVLGFSLRYPPDLTAEDLTGPSPDGIDYRLIKFGSSGDSRRGFTVSFSQASGRSLEEWAIEYAACGPTTTQSAALAGFAAISCVRETAEGEPGTPAIVAKKGDLMVLISVGGLTEVEFNHLINSFRF